MGKRYHGEMQHRLNDSFAHYTYNNHPKWIVNDVIDCKIDCDFPQMYEPALGTLTNQIPDVVIIAAGSDISVDWQRKKFNLT